VPAFLAVGVVLLTCTTVGLGRYHSTPLLPPSQQQPVVDQPAPVEG
jgi:hypothetical protein